MRILIDYLLWLAFTAFYFVCGLAYFPQTDHRLLIGLSILLGWLTAMALVLLWKLKNSPIRKPAPAEDADSNDKTKYPGGPANHFVGLIADGGWLSFHPDGLVFKPHAINFPRKEWSIRYSDIADVQSGPMKNLIIIAKSGASDVFVVNKKQKWIDNIKHRMQSA